MEPISFGSVAGGRLEFHTSYSLHTENKCYITITAKAKRADYSENSDGYFEVSAPGFSPSSANGKPTLNGSYKTVGTFDTTVITDGNGRADVSFFFKVGIYSPTYGKWYYSSKTIDHIDCGTPPTLAGASTVSCNSTAQMGKKLLISINRGDDQCRHTLLYNFGTKSETIAEDVGSSYEWTVPDLAYYCNDSTSGTCAITCKTYRSGNYLGANTATTELRVPDPTIPKLNTDYLTCGSSYEVNVRRNSSNFTNIVSFQFQSSNKEIYWGSGSSFAFKPEYDLAKLIPNLTEGTGRIICETYNGSALVGSESTTVSISVPENDTTSPVITEFSISPVSGLPPEFDGLYMRSLTGISLTVSAESTYSTISGYSMAVGITTVTGQSPLFMESITVDGTVNVLIKATDSRGFSTQKIVPIQVIPYAPPKIIPFSGYDSIICERCTDDGQLSSQGTYLAIRAGKQYTSVILNGAEKNGCHLSYRWKASSSPEYGDWITLLPESSPRNEISTIIANVVSSLSSSYSVQLSVADKLGGEYTLTFSIMTEAVSFVLYDGVDGAAFGKYPEEPHVVDIASHMTLRVRGKLVVDEQKWAELPLDLTAVAPSSEPHGRRGIPGCFYINDIGNHVIVAFNCAITAPSKYAFVNSKRIPDHLRPKNIVTSICSCDGGMAAVSVYSDGNILIEWIFKPGSTPNTATTIKWIDGYIDYFAEE